VFGVYHTSSCFEQFRITTSKQYRDTQLLSEQGHVSFGIVRQDGNRTPVIFYFALDLFRIDLHLDPDDLYPSFVNRPRAEDRCSLYHFDSAASRMCLRLAPHAAFLPTRTRRRIPRLGGSAHAMFLGYFPLQR
jgi:hypothetical protein